MSTSRASALKVIVYNTYWNQVSFMNFVDLLSHTRVQYQKTYWHTYHVIKRSERLYCYLLANVLYFSSLDRHWQELRSWELVLKKIFFPCNISKSYVNAILKMSLNLEQSNSIDSLLEGVAHIQPSNTQTNTQNSVCQIAR